jgi:AcrR family transcriptional regulator
MNDEERKDQILDAARGAFLQFGFSRTSMDEIARRARVSRPLVYKKFDNKERVLAALFERSYQGRPARVAEVLESDARPRRKLREIVEICWLEPWDELMGSPMARELYDNCERVDPEGEARRAKLRLRALHEVLGSKELAEIFEMAVDGVCADLPSTATLRKRIDVLVERFT